MPELPGLKQERLNARRKNRIWRPYTQSFHPYNGLSLGKADNWYICSLEEIYLHKERKDIKWISETKCTFGYLLSLMLKPKARLKDAQFIFWFFIAMIFYLFCIIHIFVLSCLCDHLAYINIFFWINILLFISEVVNCTGYSFLHALVLITWIGISSIKLVGFITFVCILNIQRNIQRKSLFYPARLLSTTTHNVGWNICSKN